eukprot:1159299-Pelagomonas_calceolata.AAC.6
MVRTTGIAQPGLHKTEMVQPAWLGESECLRLLCGEYTAHSTTAYCHGMASVTRNTGSFLHARWLRPSSAFRVMFASSMSGGGLLTWEGSDLKHQGTHRCRRLEGGLQDAKIPNNRTFQL